MSSTTHAVLEQIRVCAKISIDCMDLNPAKRPDIQQIIEMFDVEECSKEFFQNWHEYIVSGRGTFNHEK